jgi:hypothetical protein
MLITAVVAQVRVEVVKDTASAVEAARFALTPIGLGAILMRLRIVRAVTCSTLKLNVNNHNSIMHTSPQHPRIRKPF